MPDTADTILAIGFQDGDRALVAVDEIGIASTFDVAAGEVLKRRDIWGHPVPPWNLALAGFWLFLWVRTDRQRRRTVAGPVGERDLGVYLLAATSALFVVTAWVLGNRALWCLHAEDASSALGVLGGAALATSVVLLVGGLTRRFRSRLVFTLPSLVISSALVVRHLLELGYL